MKIIKLILDFPYLISLYIITTERKPYQRDDRCINGTIGVSTERKFFRYTVGEYIEKNAIVVL